MQILLSPSKSMDMAPTLQPDFTVAAFLEQSAELVEEARKLSIPELMDFMGISEKLAVLNKVRFADWQPPKLPGNAKQAMLAFTGDVYDGLMAQDFDRDDIDFAQDHLRILSGLYGLLKPLDLIMPYRLEMGRALKTKDADNLYGFWKETITETLNDLEGDCIINLASQEYFKAVDKRKLEKTIISPVFKDEKNGTYKIISFYAKKARGIMANWMIKNAVTDPEQLKEFAEAGYRYDAELSKPNEPVFTRPEQK